MSNLLEKFEENFAKIEKGIVFAKDLSEQINNIEEVVSSLINEDNKNPGDNTISKEKITELHAKAVDMKGIVEYIFVTAIKLIDFIMSFFKKDEDESADGKSSDEISPSAAEAFPLSEDKADISV